MANKAVDIVDRLLLKTLPMEINEKCDLKMKNYTMM